MPFWKFSIGLVSGFGESKQKRALCVCVLWMGAQQHQFPLYDGVSSPVNLSGWKSFSLFSLSVGVVSLSLKHTGCVFHSTGLCVCVCVVVVRVFYVCASNCEIERKTRELSLTVKFGMSRKTLRKHMKSCEALYTHTTKAHKTHTPLYGLYGRCRVVVFCCCCRWRRWEFPRKTCVDFRFVVRLKWECFVSMCVCFYMLWVFVCLLVYDSMFFASEARKSL